MGAMKTKRVLVTGASGFVGRPLVAALVRAGYTVRAATRRPASFPDLVEFVTVPDFIYPIDWSPFLQSVDIVVHLAGLAHSRNPDTDYSEFDQINRIATQRLANAAKSVGVERFVYISSVRAQTGASATWTVRESDEPSPTNQYGRAKLAAERAIQAVVPFTIFRPVVIYGRRPKGNMRMVVRLARSPLPLPVFNNRRSLLAVDNLISAIVFALNNPDMIGETYLVADSKPMTMSEIFTILRMVRGRRLTSVHIPHVLIRLALMVIGRTDLWSRLSGELLVDTGKLEAAGWRPAVETYGGLREMVSAENEESPRP